jgi:hypothetical protein
MRLSFALLIGVVGCTACSDDGPSADPYRCAAAGGDACFELPTDFVAAANELGAAVLPELGCGVYPIASSAGAITLEGHIVDFDNQLLLIEDVRLEAFGDPVLSQLLFDETSDSNGAWSASAVVPNLVFARTTAAGQLPIHFMYGRIDIGITTQSMVDFVSATKTQVSARFEAVGDRFLPAKSQLIATATDCAGNRLVNVIGNVAPASGKNGTRLFESGVRTYYGKADAGEALGRRTELSQTTSAGTFGVANLSPGKHFVQLWGFPTAAALAMGSLGLELLDEKELLVFDGEAGYMIELNGHL